jgi:hypothetical protein
MLETSERAEPEATLPVDVAIAVSLDETLVLALAVSVPLFTFACESGKPA